MSAWRSLRASSVNSDAKTVAIWASRRRDSAHRAIGCVHSAAACAHLAETRTGRHLLVESDLHRQTMSHYRRLAINKCDRKSALLKVHRDRHAHHPAAQSHAVELHCHISRPKIDMRADVIPGLRRGTFANVPFGGRCGRTDRPHLCRCLPDHRDRAYGGRNVFATRAVYGWSTHPATQATCRTVTSWTAAEFRARQLARCEPNVSQPRMLSLAIVLSRKRDWLRARTRRRRAY